MLVTRAMHWMFSSRLGTLRGFPRTIPRLAAVSKAHLRHTRYALRTTRYCGCL
jgi:hypothetical protein